MSGIFYQLNYFSALYQSEKTITLIEPFFNLFLASPEIPHAYHSFFRDLLYTSATKESFILHPLYFLCNESKLQVSIFKCCHLQVDFPVPLQHLLDLALAA